MVGGRVDMVRMVRVHGMVQMRRMMQTGQTGPVGHMGLVHASRRTVHVTRVDTIVVLQQRGEIY